MAKVLIIVTGASTLPLIDGTRHASGFWAEELVVPYLRFLEEGYDVDVATIGGAIPSVDKSSLSVQTVQATRPAGSPDHDVENIALYTETLASMPGVAGPLAIADITPEQLAGYAGVYISGGHGAMGDMPHDEALGQLLRKVLASETPLAVVCHGHSALLPLRDSEGGWLFAGYRMTAFSHAEEMVTDMAGKLPFVLQVELERLGALYEKAPLIWGSHVVEDRNVMTGQNPYSSTALADTFVKRLAESA